MSHRDTITALSSGGLPSGIAVIRVSGPAVREILLALVGDIPKPHLASLRMVRDPGGSLIDEGLVLFFAGPSSFTGEDCAEFHIHGGRAVVQTLLNAICSFPDSRLAEAGEFMRRAFTNGKVDLLGAEATADILAADTAAQLRFALQNRTRVNADLYERWRHDIIGIRALLEAELDFADEGDVSLKLDRTSDAPVEMLCHQIKDHLAGFHSGEILMAGLDVLIIGAPNAGKSSLLNALARREVAIVSPEPGTTRDLLEIALDLDGYKVRLTDSAGIRNPESPVEAIGIQRAIQRIAEADLILLLDDGSEDATSAQAAVANHNCWMVATKADIRPEPASDGLAISASSGLGLDALLKRLGSEAARLAAGFEAVPWKMRHVHLLAECTNWLEASIQPRMPDELRAEHLRLAANSLGRITGRIDVEDLLDVIFSTFCIGK